MKYILILFCTFITLNAYGQKINVALKFGGGIAEQHITNEGVISVSSIGTINFSGLAWYNIPHQFAIQAGLGIANKGAIITEDAITTTQHITYLDIPINIVKGFSFPGLGNLYIGAGGYASRALSGRNSFETPNSTSSEKLEFGSSRDLQYYDAGLNFTTGLQLNNKLLFDIRYALGLKNLTTDPLKDTGTSAIYNRLLTISLGYVIK